MVKALLSPLSDAAGAPPAGVGAESSRRAAWKASASSCSHASVTAVHAKVPPSGSRSQPRHALVP